MHSNVWAPAITLALCGALAGCGDDDAATTTPPQDGGGLADTATPPAPDAGAPDPDAGSPPDDDAGSPAPGDASTPPAVEFEVVVENISGGTSLPTPFSPIVWATHASPDLLFTEGMPDPGAGLAAVAEDADATPLSEALAADPDVAASGVVAVPEGASEPGPARPGGAYRFRVTASAASPRLSFASMIGQSNDVFLGPDGEGIALFDDDGRPLPEQDVTDRVALWDVGTELNETPGSGPSQAPRQAAPMTGPAEGVVAPFTSSTRSLPLGAGVAEVTVTKDGTTYEITVRNVTVERGAFSSPIAPLFYAVHDASFSLFQTGSPASSALEMLAEDGSPAAMVEASTGAPGTLLVGAVTSTVERPDEGPGPALPGESFRIRVLPDASHRFLSFAGMVGQTNDAFIALRPEGVALLDDAAGSRSVQDVERDIRRSLAVWDAGTEANEVPGIGPNQAPRQPARNTGPADPDRSVRLYRDSTNDLAGPRLGGFVELSITATSATDTSFTVVVRNGSAATAFPGLLTPVAWATHDASAAFFTPGAPASRALEQLAEDGVSLPFAEAMREHAGVAFAAVANTPDGEPGPGALAPGASYTFTVIPDAEHRYLSLATMIVPSNDTFAAFGPEGVALLDESGARRLDADIAADVAASLRAWDAGTEQNQAGAGGRDMAPVQAAPGDGAGEGSGLVRRLDDPVWDYPAAMDLLRVTVRPVPTE